jgi:hypothetical protein
MFVLKLEVSVSIMQWVSDLCSGWVGAHGSNLYYLEIVLLLHFCCYITSKLVQSCIGVRLMTCSHLWIASAIWCGFFDCADFEDVPAYQLSLVEDTNAVTQLVGLTSSSSSSPIKTRICILCCTMSIRMCCWAIDLGLLLRNSEKTHNHLIN